MDLRAFIIIPIRKEMQTDTLRFHLAPQCSRRAEMGGTSMFPPVNAGFAGFDYLLRAFSDKHHRFLGVAVDCYIVCSSRQPRGLGAVFFHWLSSGNQAARTSKRAYLNSGKP